MEERLQLFTNKRELKHQVFPKYIYTSRKGPPQAARLERMRGQEAIEQIRRVLRREELLEVSAGDDAGDVLVLVLLDEIEVSDTERVPLSREVDLLGVVVRLPLDRDLVDEVVGDFLSDSDILCGEWER